MNALERLIASKKTGKTETVAAPNALQRLIESRKQMVPEVQPPVIEPPKAAETVPEKLVVPEKALAEKRSDFISAEDLAWNKEVERRKTPGAVVSEVPDLYNEQGEAAPLHRRPKSAPTLSPERYKSIEADIKAYESGAPKRADGFTASSDDVRNIAKRIESTDDVAEQERLRDLRSELKKRGTYKEERFLETRESPEQKAEITAAAKPIVEQYKAAAQKVEDAPSELNFTQYDLTRDLDNQIAAELKLDKKRALLEARRQLKEAKYIDDDESSLGKEVLASFGTGANMLAKGGNELARWGMKGLYALANDTSGLLTPGIKEAIDLEKIGRANDEKELMQNLDFVSQKLQENAADLASAREDANPGITARREKIMAATGFVDAIKKSLADPGATLGIIGDSLPLMAAGGVAGKAIAGAAGATTASGMIAGQVAGEALVAGAVNASSVRDQLMQPEVQEQIRAMPEWDVALGAAGGDEDKAMRNIVDMAAGTAGVTSAGLTAFFGKLMSGVNAQIAGAEVRRGLLPYTRSVLSEAGQEAGQEGGDKFAENIAVRTTGIDRNPFEGVPAASGMGSVMGSGMAAGIAAPQLLGGQAEEDARVLSLAADRDRMRLNELEDAARERHSVARAAPTGDPDIDAGNALAEDAFQAARDRPSALDLQEKQEADELRTRLAAITSAADQQAASQALDQTVDQRILEAQQETENAGPSAGAPIPLGNTGLDASDRSAGEISATQATAPTGSGNIAAASPRDVAELSRPREQAAAATDGVESFGENSRAGDRDNRSQDPVVAGGIDQTQGAVDELNTLRDSARGSAADAQPVSDQDSAGSSESLGFGIQGRNEEIQGQNDVVGQETQNEGITDDLRTPDAGVVEEPQTVGRKLPPAYMLTAAELEQRNNDRRAFEEDLEKRTLGDQRDAWRRALRIQNSSNPERSAQGTETLERIESGLSKADRDALYGIGVDDDLMDDVDDFRQAVVDAENVSNPAEASERLGYHLSQLGTTEGQDPSGWTRQQQVSYAASRAIGERIAAEGWDSASIQKNAIGRAASRFADPDDAAFMLNRFLKPSANAKSASQLQLEDQSSKEPQTVDQNLVELADLLSQEGSTDPLPPEGISDEQAEIIPSLESEIGWDQRGGGIVRNEEGKVTGRLPWIARPSILGGISEFWRGRPEPITEQAASKAIEKFRNGERLAPIERRFVAYAGQYAQQIAEENQAYNEAGRAASREPKTFTAPDGTEIRYSKPRGLSALERLSSGANQATEQVDGPRYSQPSRQTGGLDVDSQGTDGFENSEGIEVTEVDLSPEEFARLFGSPASSAAAAGSTSQADQESAADAWRSKKTDSPWFQRWFGSSKAVDRSGKPRLFHHGTADAFIQQYDPARAGQATGYAPSGLGMWLTADRNLAKMYSQSGKVLDGYVSMQNPLTIRPDQLPEFDTVQEYKRYAKGLQDKGYDGILIPAANQAVIFNSNQYKTEDNRGDFSADPRFKFSKPKTVSEAVGDARKAAEKAWGKRLIDKLTRNGILTFVSRDDVRKMNASRPKNRQIDVTANAFVDENNKAFVINENVSDDMAPGIVLHEVGVHYGLEAMVGKEVFDKILADLRSLRATDKRVQEAYQRAMESDGHRKDKMSPEAFEKLIDEETLAYMAEMSPQHGLIQRLIDALVTFFKRIGFQNEGFLNESRSDEMLRIIRNSLRNAGKPKTGGVVYSEYDNAYSQPEKGDNFYSAMLRSVEQAKGAPKTGTTKQWKEWLDGAQRRGEFKQSERDWLGVDAWLDGREQTTRKELADFVRANEVQVSDVVLGGSAQETLVSAGSDLIDHLVNVEMFGRRGAQDYALDVARGDLSEGQLRSASSQTKKLSSALADAYKKRNESKDVPSKFSGYRTPGDGKNYRELLLTLPPQGAIAYTKDNVTAIRDSAESPRPDFFWYFRTPDNVLQIPKSRYSSETDALNYVLRAKQPEAPADKNYKSSHWDQPNVLAHVRFDERTDKEGRKVLFIQEIQSDLHQDGRKKGYAGQKERLEQEMANARRDMYSATNDSERAAASQRMQDAGIALGRVMVNGGVPNAPLKSTDEWATIAFKRMARWGAENGFDKISWATGEQNADVFDLSKRVSRIEYEKNPSDNTFNVMAHGLDGQGLLWSNRRATSDQIADAVGKEVAEKIVAGEGNRVGGVGSDTMSLSGEGLKVGGAGMRGFYDKILPATVNKWAKPFGARTEMTEVAGNMQPTITITPKMREAALKGLPLFSKPKGIRYSTPRSPSIIPAQQRAAQNRQTLESGLGANPQQPSFVATDWFQSGIMGSLRNLKEAFQDKLAPVLFIQRDIEQAGRIIGEYADVHNRENLMHGRVGNTLEMDERNYIAPLKSYMREGKLSYHMLDDYLEARHAQERNEDVAKKNQGMQDGGSGMTTQQAKDFLDGTDKGLRSNQKLTPDMKRKMDRAASYLDRLLAESRDRMLNNGLITQGEYDALKKYQFYVPLKNELDGREMGFGGGRGAGIDARPAALRNALGRGAGNRAGDILAHALGDTQRLVTLGEKTRVGRTLARLVLDNPNKDVWEVEPVVIEQKLNTAGEVYLGLQNLQNDPLTMVIKFEGKPYKIKFGDNPVGRRLAASLKNLNNLDAKAYNTIFGGINRFYSKMMTSYSPAFMVVNMMRDLFYGTTGIGAEKGNKALRLAIKYYFPSMRAIFRDGRGTAQTNPLVESYLKEYGEAGGKTFFNEGKQAEDYQKDQERFMKGYFKLLSEGSPIEMMTKFVEENSVMKLINDTNNAIENSLRLSAFIALRETGETVEQAAKYAKNMTVNFNRKGSASTFMNATYLFFNAAVQGAHRTIQLLKNRKVQATMASLFGMQAWFAFLLAGREDDDGVPIADKIPDHVWQKNFVIPWKDSENGYFTIPMPYGFNVFSYAGGRIARETAGVMKGDQLKPFDMAADIGAAVVGSFSPINASMGWHTFVPTLPGQLITQSKSNETSFGSPIRDEWLDDKQARAYQGKASTPMFYHTVAQALSNAFGGTTKEKPAMALFTDQAPEDIKFLVENIGGGPLRFLSQLFGVGESIAYGAETGPGDFPLVSAIIPRTDKGSGTQRVYYYKTLPAIVNDEEIIKEAAKRGEDWQDAPVKPEMQDTFKVARKKDGTRAKPPKGSLGPKLEPVRGSLPDIKRQVEKAVKELRDEMRAIRNDPEMTHAKKKLAIDKINKEIASEMAILINEQRTQRREARKQQ